MDIVISVVTTLSIIISIGSVACICYYLIKDYNKQKRINAEIGKGGKK